MWTLPNILTIARLVLLPFIIMLIYAGSAGALWLALLLYIIGALTDFLDGFAARTLNQVSEFGTFLDPICDKIYVTLILLVLVDTGVAGGINAIAVMAIITRELLVSGLREYLGPKNIQVPVTKMAKWKTALQMICLGFLIVAPMNGFFFYVGSLLLLIAAVLTVITGWGYLKTGLAEMQEKA